MLNHSTQPIKQYGSLQKRIDELVRIQDAAGTEQDELETLCNELIAAGHWRAGVYPVSSGHVVVSHIGSVEFHAST